MNSCPNCTNPVGQYCDYCSDFLSLVTENRCVAKPKKKKLFIGSGEDVINYFNDYDYPETLEEAFGPCPCG